MTTKRLEVVGGGFRQWTRAELVGASRDALQSYLEARGFAVYDGEKTSALRECALDDFDGEDGVNRDGLTWREWYAAATLGKNDDPASAPPELVDAWKQGVDPTEYAAR